LRYGHMNQGVIVVEVDELLAGSAQHMAKAHQPSAGSQRQGETKTNKQMCQTAGGLCCILAPHPVSSIIPGHRRKLLGVQVSQFALPRVCDRKCEPDYHVRENLIRHVNKEKKKQSDPRHTCAACAV